MFKSASGYVSKKWLRMGFEPMPASIKQMNSR